MSDPSIAYKTLRHEHRLMSASLDRVRRLEWPESQWGTAAREHEKIMRAFTAACFTHLPALLLEYRDAMDASTDEATEGEG